MTTVDPLSQPQQLASAAEQFVRTLARVYPGGGFEQFFHAETVRRAYWAALRQAIERYARLDDGTRVNGVAKSALLARPRVVGELVKLFLPGQAPDYGAVAEEWRAALDGRADRATLATQAETLFSLIAEALFQSPDLRLVLQQLAQTRAGAPAEAAPPGADLDRLLEAALAEGPATLNRQVRHLIALTANRGASPPHAAPDRLVALAQVAGALTPEELRAAWTAAAQVMPPAERARIVALLAPHLARIGERSDPLTLLREIFAAAEPPVPPAARVAALLALLPHLGAVERSGALPNVQQRLLHAALAIPDPASRVRALGALIEKLPPDLQHSAVEHAFKAASGIPSDMAGATALAALPPHLPPEFHNRLIALAQGLRAPDARAYLFTRMLAYVEPGLRRQVLSAALDAIAAINGDDARAQALIALAQPIETTGLLQDNPDGVQQAITVTFAIGRADARARAFAVLAPYLSAELLTEALQALKSIHDDADRALTLAQLAPHLTPGLSVAAYTTAQELGSSAARAGALSAIAPYLSAAARAKALADALAAALAIERRYDRVTALVDLAPHLPDVLRARALGEALTAARSITDEDERGRALVFLAPHLPEDRLADALADAYTIATPVTRAPALSALMRFLPDEPCARVADAVIGAAAEAARPSQTASMLAAVARVLPDAALDRAVEVALTIEPPYDRLHALTALLPRRPDHLRDAALAAARAVPDTSERVNALLELVPHHRPALRYAILDEALDAALELRDSYDRASALATLAPYIDAQTYLQNRQQDALELALAASLEIEDTATRAEMLHRWAEACAARLTPAQSYTLWRAAAAALRGQSHAAALRDLAALAPLLAHMGGGGALGEIAAALHAAP